MSSPIDSGTWPKTLSEEKKAERLLVKASSTKKKFGKLETKKKPQTPTLSEKELVNHKLRSERQFFDSADYFRQLQVRIPLWCPLLFFFVVVF
jgi:hypothetical protein